MADQKISELTALGAAPASGDQIPINDVDVTTTKSMTVGNLFTAPTFTTSITIGSATISEAELEILDGATVTTTEFNYVSGVTSAIQTQINAKAPTASPTVTSR
jgi:hypothetical protein